MSCKASKKESEATQYDEEVTKYINSYEGDTKKKLEQMRETIHSVSDEIKERWAWQMPTFVYHGNLVHFAAMKGHLGWYPTPSAITEFAEELKGYSTSKGCVRIPWKSTLPLDLIKRMVEFRMKENLEEESSKSKKKCGSSK